jgi:hypothetical protein
LDYKKVVDLLNLSYSLEIMTSAIAERGRVPLFASFSRRLADVRIGRALKQFGMGVLTVAIAACFLLPEPAFTKAMGLVLVQLLQVGFVSTGSGLLLESLGI